MNYVNGLGVVTLLQDVALAQGRERVFPGKLLYLSKNKEVAQPNRHITSTDNSQYVEEMLCVDSFMSTIYQVIVFP